MVSPAIDGIDNLCIQSQCPLNVATWLWLSQLRLLVNIKSLCVTPCCMFICHSVFHFPDDGRILRIALLSLQAPIVITIGEWAKVFQLLSKFSKQKWNSPIYGYYKYMYACLIHPSQLWSELVIHTHTQKIVFDMYHKLLKMLHCYSICHSP